MKDNNEKKDLFGWKVVFNSYTSKDTFKDCIVPIVLSLLVTATITILSLNAYQVLYSIINISLDILPSIISFLIAAYAIILTMFWSEYGKRIRKYKNGRKLLTNLNSSFAAIILFMVIGLIFNLIICVFISMEIKPVSILIGYIVNIIIIFVTLTVLLFSIYSLKDIIINLFNLGQIIPIFDKGEENTDQSKNNS